MNDASKASFWQRSRLDLHCEPVRVLDICHVGPSSEPFKGLRCRRTSPWPSTFVMVVDHRTGLGDEAPPKLSRFVKLHSSAR